MTTEDAEELDRRAERKQAILKAALEIFVEEGFASARIEDVAARAGIAKGTIYLYFRSKEELFRSLIGTVAEGPLARLARSVEGADGTTEALLRKLFGIVQEEILETDRRLVVRLIIAEAQRFPEIADLYYDVVVSRAMDLLRAVCRRGVERGELVDDSLVRFPQLIVAPFMLAVIWDALFRARAPLDVEALFDAHIDILMRGLRGPEE